MTWSLNEIEALARKAARGAGYSWGEAEEAGQATRWLEARDLPGVTTLATHLGWADGRPRSEIQPLSTAGQDGAPSGALCPILTGIALEDGLISLPVDLGNTRAPLLLLPFLAWSSERQEVTTTAVIDGSIFTLTPEGTLFATAGSPDGQSAVVRRTQGAKPKGSPVPVGLRSRCSAGAVEMLNTFATRTYAPATDESRLAGAGAGLTDND